MQVHTVPVHVHRHERSSVLRRPDDSTQNKIGLNSLPFCSVIMADRKRKLGSATEKKSNKSRKDDDSEISPRDESEKEDDKQLPLEAGESTPPKDASKDKKKKAKKKKKLKTQNDRALNDDDDDQAKKTTDVVKDDSESDDEDELLAAAAAWAENDGGDEESKNGPAATSMASSSTTDLSLHITQLPYDTIELDLRRLFAEHGCAVTSIRLVYDRDDKGRKTVFRGVAFVDLLNSASYDKALSLNRKSTIRGRKLNIRPTRSKQELADIVTRTRELVQEKIKKQLEDGNANDGSKKSESPKSSKKEQDKQKKKKKEKKEKAKAAKAQSKLKSKHDPPSGRAEGEPKKPKAEKKEEHKLTKKERNRRAAIIMGFKRKSKGAKK